MQLDERALFGLPIETSFGELKPLTVYDYMDCASQLTAMTFDKKRLLHEIRLNQPNKEKQNSKEMTDLLKQLNKELTIKQILINYVSLFFNAYIEITARCLFFNEDNQEERINKATEFLNGLDDKDFEELRKILLYMNGQSEQTAFLNPQMQRKREQGIKFHSKENSESPNIPTIVTSIVAYTGLKFEDILGWNVTQLLQMFQRIQMFKGYDVTTLFATVAGDKVEIQEWSQNIEIKNDSNTDSTFAMEFAPFEQKIQKQLE